MKRPTKRILEAGFPVTGKLCEIRKQAGTTEGGAEITIEGEEYGLYCEGNLIAVGNPDRLSEWALFEGGAKEVAHSYDLRHFGEGGGAP